ncbi:MAG: hypothetical protein R6U37_00865 [Dehalococcoidia bacterium]
MKNNITNAVKVVYALIIAAFLIMAVTFGIDAFYAPPERSDPGQPPENLIRPYPDIEPPAESEEHEQWQANREAYEAELAEWNELNQQAWESHNDNMADHHQTIFFIAYPIGLICIIMGLELKLRLDILKPGITIGGLGIIIYAISQPDLNNTARFIGVALGLVILIYIGYRTLAERKNPTEES